MHLFEKENVVFAKEGLISPFLRSQSLQINVIDIKMAAQGGQATEPWPNLSNLIKELSASQAREELQRAAHLPKVQKQIEKHLTNVAFSQLLGLKEVPKNFAEL